MAAAVIPIALSIFPLIAAISTPLIQLAQTHLPKSSRMQAVLTGLLSFLNPLATSGALQQAVPSEAELQPIIEGVLAQLKNTGQLVPGLVTPPTAATNTDQGIAMAQSILTAIQTQNAK